LKFTLPIAALHSNLGQKSTTCDISLNSNDEKQKFSEKVANLVQDEVFLSEFSDRIGEPLEHESEDEFVKRGSETLRQMLYDKFGIKD
jgi:hypothetical protein